MKKRPANTNVPRASGAVDEFMKRLDHPLKPGIEALRKVVRGVSPSITEEIKWNSPGFRTKESFATMHLRSVDRLRVILHLGAKVRPGLKAFAIDDPAGMVKWLGKDRCMVTIGALPRDKDAFANIIRQWIAHV